MMRDHWKGTAVLGVACMSIILMSGCFGRSKPPYLVEEYVLDYPVPAAASGAVTASLRIERFSVARAYNSRAMVYRPAPRRVSTYEYHRWRVNPADMATDYLLRDFRASGAFQAVFSHHSTERPRYVLEGAVEEFEGIYEAKPPRASFVLSVVLMDLAEEEITKRIKFQKTYRVFEPLAGESPDNLALGMSKAVSRVFGELIVHVAGAVKSP